MSKVIQIRGVSDEVHRKLVAAAEADGKSLTAYLNDELGLIARRADLVWHNREVIEALRADFGGPRGSRAETARALEEGRAERERQLARPRRRT